MKFGYFAFLENSEAQGVYFGTATDNVKVSRLV